MGYTRETARRVDNDPGYLINNCLTLDQEIVSKDCPTKPLAEGGSE
jgi:cytochrome d ubiquinol oxidase subunit I